ncbi:MAG: hypothetical protein J0H09_27965 [Burkholderiales bacterium]|nr:hypothetical protein [Burkholderiales bacterium]
MSDPKKRIRWTIEERRTLAQRLAEVLRAEPRLSKLQAMDRAQTALPPERRRHLAAWSTVREFIEPYMPALGAEVADDAVAETDAGTAGDEVEAHGADTLPLPLESSEIDEAPTQAGDLQPTAAPGDGQDTAAGGVPDPIEAALLRALSSPRVADKLAALFASAMGRALDQAQSGAPANAASPKANAGPAPSPVASPRPKVLIAGISPADAVHLGEAMRNKLDLRFWRQGDSREQLRLHGRACSVAVVMSEAVDSDVEALLRSMQLRVVRHTYNASRLEERLNEMQDHGMFNLLI